jgi:hypothetical protein
MVETLLLTSAAGTAGLRARAVVHFFAWPPGRKGKRIWVRMTVPTKYANSYVPVKYFLSSYRALSDGRRGIRHLEERLGAATFLLSEWKVIWIGTCAVLRTAIDLFRVDMKSCLATRSGKRSQLSGKP